MAEDVILGSGKGWTGRWVRATGAYRAGGHETWANSSTIPHRTSQNLREKVPGHVYFTFCRHCLCYNIHHFNLPAQQGRENTVYTVDQLEHKTYELLNVVKKKKKIIFI